MDADLPDCQGRLPRDGMCNRLSPSRSIGVVGTARTEGSVRNVGGPRRRGIASSNIALGAVDGSGVGKAHSTAEAANDGGGKGPYFECACQGTKGSRRLAMRLTTPERIRRLQRKLYVKAKVSVARCRRAAPRSFPARKSSGNWVSNGSGRWPMATDRVP